MLHRLLGLALFAVASPVLAQAGFQPGTDYQLIEPAQPTGTGDRIEVIEVFGYSCPACARFQPLVDAWKADLPQDVAFSYEPAGWGGVWEMFARAFYAAQSLGVLDESHSKIFEAVHLERKPIKSAEDVAALYTEFGVSQEDFLATMNSFAVNTKLARAKQQLPRYGVEGTPTMVVDGKYRVTLDQAGFEKMLQVVDHLIAKQRLAKQAG